MPTGVISGHETQPCVQGGRRPCPFDLSSICKHPANWCPVCFYARRPFTCLSAAACLSQTQLCRHWEAGSCSRGTSCSFAHGREELRANPLHKTQLCQFWEAGLCAHGDACRYAHGLREQKDRMAVLAAPPPPPPPTARPARLQPSMGLQPVQGTAALAMGLRPVQDTAAPAAPANYKTKLCRHWQAGACPRGAACWFAHGPAEQQIYSLPPAIHVPPPVLVPPPVHMPPSALRPTRAAVLGLPAVSAIRDSTAGRSKAGQGAPAPISAHGSYKTQICRNWLAGACLFGAKCSFAHGRQEQRPKMVPAPTVLPPSRQNSGGGSGSSGIYTARPGPKVRFWQSRPFSHGVPSFPWMRGCGCAALYLYMLQQAPFWRAFKHSPASTLALPNFPVPSS